MYSLKPGGLRCISIKPDDFSECIWSLRIRNTIKTENERSLNEDKLVHHNSSAELNEAFTQKPARERSRKVLWKWKKPHSLTQTHAVLKTRVIILEDFAAGAMETWQACLLKLLSVNLKRRNTYKTQKTKVFLWAEKESVSFSTAEIRHTMLSAPGTSGSTVWPLMVLTGALSLFLLD